MGLFDKLFSKPEAEESIFNGNHIYAPVSGRAVPITDVPDPTFSGNVLGRGIAIIPTDGRVCSPFDGVVDNVLDSGHACALTSSTGVEVLIHLGLDTVRLNGSAFTLHCKNGDQVRKGQLLIEADLDAIRAAQLPIITPVVVFNHENYPAFQTVTGSFVTNDDIVINLAE